ncbi:MAG: DNA polymerase III subunit delta [Ignavibacteriales bacterium]|nr:DNA polymerase III subunit delta [Ignavibacteriales bacterium]
MKKSKSVITPAGTGETFFSLPFERIFETLTKKKFSPVYIIYGEEHFLRQQFIMEVVNNATDESTRVFNLDVLQGNETPLDRILSCAKQVPMNMLSFDDGNMTRRIVIVKNFELGRKKESEEKLFSYLRTPASSTVLTLEIPKLDLKSELYKKLSTVAVMVPCVPLSDDQALLWLGNEFSRRQLTISREVSLKILTSVGNSLNELTNAVEKILSFVGERTVISADDVKGVVGFSKVYDFDDLWKSFMQRNYPGALEILYKSIEKGEEEVGLLARLSIFLMNQLRWRKPTGDKGFSDRELHRSLSLFLQTDAKLKSAGTDKQVLMTLLLSEIVPQE